MLLFIYGLINYNFLTHFSPTFSFWGVFCFHLQCQDTIMGSVFRSFPCGAMHLQFVTAVSADDQSTEVGVGKILLWPFYDGGWLFSKLFSFWPVSGFFFNLFIYSFFVVVYKKTCKVNANLKKNQSMRK